MRFEKGHKAATRRHIVDVASKRFRREGVSAAGIAGIMGEAGLTNGAFYPHFESKDALVREAVASALADQQHRLDEDRRTGLDLEDTIRGVPEPRPPRRPGRGVPFSGVAPRNRSSGPAHSADLRGRAAELRFDACRPASGRRFQQRARRRATVHLRAGWWELSSLREQCPTLPRRSRYWKGGVEAALRLEWNATQSATKRHFVMAVTSYQELLRECRGRPRRAGGPSAGSALRLVDPQGAFAGTDCQWHSGRASCF